MYNVHETYLPVKLLIVCFTLKCGWESKKAYSKDIRGKMH